MRSYRNDILENHRHYRGKDGSIIMKGRRRHCDRWQVHTTKWCGLQAYLSGMSASQIDAVELIETRVLNMMLRVMQVSSILRLKPTGKVDQWLMNLSIGQGFYPNR
jgi:hypothetical protein